MRGLRGRMRAGLNREHVVIYLTVLITVLLFVYLGVALIRPEWF